MIHSRKRTEHFETGLGMSVLHRYTERVLYQEGSWIPGDNHSLLALGRECTLAEKVIDLIHYRHMALANWPEREQEVNRDLGQCGSRPAPRLEDQWEVMVEGVAVMDN